MSGRKMVALVVAMLWTFALSSCRRTERTVVLQREWTANAEFAGDVLGSEISAKLGSPFEVREGSEIIDPVKLVRAGDVQFGVASADRVLQENEAGAGLVILGTACFRSPVVFLVQAESGISSPEDFRGRTIGIQSGTNTELVFRSLLDTNGLSASDMKVVESGWGTANFETKALDVLAAFDYDEPVQLDLKGVRYTVIRPESHGVNFVGTVYFTSNALASSNPTLVQSFVDNLVAGWRAAMLDPKYAIERISNSFPSVDTNKELLSLERGKVYFSGEDGRVLYASRNRWEEMGRHLVDLGAITTFSFQEAVDYRFLELAFQPRAEPN